MYKLDYKRKHFVLTDERLETSSQELKMPLTEEFMTEHVSTCISHGIPPYIGNNEKILDLVESIYHKIINNIDQKKDELQSM